MKSETAGRIAVIITCSCIAVVIATLGLLVMQTRFGLVPAASPSYAVGATVDVPASVYSGASHTLILFGRSTCSVCQSVKPSLVEIIRAVERQNDVRSVLVTGGAHLPDEIQYAAELGLGPERVFPLTPQTRNLKHVPTFVLVDRQGKVLASEEGGPSISDPGVIARVVALVQPR